MIVNAGILARECDSGNSLSGMIVFIIILLIILPKMFDNSQWGSKVPHRIRVAGSILSQDQREERLLNGGCCNFGI
jgi:hypothetical protein